LQLIIDVPHVKVVITAFSCVYYSLFAHQKQVYYNQYGNYSTNRLKGVCIVH